MSTPLHLKPPVAAWIVRERRRMGLKPRDVAERLSAMGLDVTEATVKVWESNADRRPSPYNLEGLERIFDSKAPTPVPQVSDSQAVAAAIDRLGDRLLATIEAQGRAQARSTDELASVLGGVMSQLAAILERTPNGSAGAPEGHPVGQ